MQTSSNAFAPYIDGGGLQLSVLPGVALIGTTPTTIIGQSIALTANTTNYVYLNLTSGTIEVNTSGFTSGVYPIAVVTTLDSSLKTLMDSRTDVFSSSSGGGSGGPSTATLTAGAGLAVGMVVAINDSGQAVGQNNGTEVTPIQACIGICTAINSGSATVQLNGTTVVPAAQTSGSFTQGDYVGTPQSEPGMPGVLADMGDALDSTAGWMVGICMSVDGSGNVTTLIQPTCTLSGSV